MRARRGGAPARVAPQRDVSLTLTRRSALRPARHAHPAPRGAWRCSARPPPHAPQAEADRAAFTHLLRADRVTAEKRLRASETAALKAAADLKHVMAWVGEKQRMLLDERSELQGELTRALLF